MTEITKACYCDRCRKKMPEPDLIGFKIGHKTFAISRLKGEWTYLDLCEDCIKSFGKWIDQEENECSKE